MKKKASGISSGAALEKRDSCPRGAFDARGLLCVSCRLFAGHGDYAAHFAPSPPSARAAAQADARNRRSRTPAHDAALSVALDPPTGLERKTGMGAAVFMPRLYILPNETPVSRIAIFPVWQPFSRTRPPSAAKLSWQRKQKVSPREAARLVSACLIDHSRLHVIGITGYFRQKPRRFPGCGSPGAVPSPRGHHIFQHMRSRLPAASSFCDQKIKSMCATALQYLFVFHIK